MTPAHDATCIHRGHSSEPRAGCVHDVAVKAKGSNSIPNLHRPRPRVASQYTCTAARCASSIRHLPRRPNNQVRILYLVPAAAYTPTTPSRPSTGGAATRSCLCPSSAAPAVCHPLFPTHRLQVSDLPVVVTDTHTPTRHPSLAVCITRRALCGPTARQHPLSRCSAATRATVPPPRPHGS